MIDATGDTMTLEMVNAVLVVVAEVLALWLLGRVRRQFGAYSQAHAKDQITKQQLVKVIEFYDAELSRKENAA